MATFFGELLLYGGIVAIVSIPIVLVARDKGRAPLARKFMVAAAIVGVVCGFLGWTSRILVDQCTAAGNTACVDYGGSGIQFTLVVIYAVVALSTAGSLARD